MIHFLRFCIRALFAYVIAAPLTSRISMDVAHTSWTDLWTYVFWTFGLFIWMGIFAGAALAVGLGAAFLDPKSRD
jgi:hypothetical protein